MHGDDDAAVALNAAGIHDPVALPVVLADDADVAANLLGRGGAPNLGALIEFEPAGFAPEAGEATPDVA
ncbi:MAG TPA: hypothetical protein PLD10_06830, partial [Rhodopila sp.]|nr:hypothetical protein [Rhodopila sp.]